MITSQMVHIFGSPDMSILPPLPINPARSREGDNGLFSSISSSFRPIVGLSGAGGRAALRWRGGQVFSLRFCGEGDRPNQEVAHSSERRRKQKGREGRSQRNWCLLCAQFFEAFFFLKLCSIFVGSFQNLCWMRNLEIQFWRNFSCKNNTNRSSSRPWLILTRALFLT